MTFELAYKIVTGALVLLSCGLGLFAIFAIILGARADDAMEEGRNGHIRRKD